MSIEGPEHLGKKHEWKIFDIKYFENEIDRFEKFYVGEINLGPIKITREFIKCEDRLAIIKGVDDAFAYYTKF